MKESPSKFSNTVKDTIGIMRAISYRSFVARNWSKPQPMFNILEVKTGEDELFKKFLADALVVSLKYDTPLSIGPYITTNSGNKTFIYVTHYASTKSFVKVMNGLLFKGISKIRAKATKRTSWTYCEPTNAPQLTELTNITMVSVQGNVESFLNLLNTEGIAPAATVKKIKDVRGHSLDNHLIFADTPAMDALLDKFRSEGGDFQTTKASTY